MFDAGDSTKYIRVLRTLIQILHLLEALAPNLLNITWVRHKRIVGLLGFAMSVSMNVPLTSRLFLVNRRVLGHSPLYPTYVDTAFLLSNSRLIMLRYISSVSKHIEGCMVKSMLSYYRKVSVWAEYFPIFLGADVSIIRADIYRINNVPSNDSGNQEFTCNFWELCYDYAPRRVINSQ